MHSSRNQLGADLSQVGLANLEGIATSNPGQAVTCPLSAWSAGTARYRYLAAYTRACIFNIRLAGSSYRNLPIR